VIIVVIVAAFLLPITPATWIATMLPFWMPSKYVTALVNEKDFDAIETNNVNEALYKRAIFMFYITRLKNEQLGPLGILNFGSLFNSLQPEVEIALNETFSKFPWFLEKYYRVQFEIDRSYLKNMQSIRDLPKPKSSLFFL
jgi:hypothetical protein